MLVDVGHNPQAARVLGHLLRRESASVGGRTHAVFAALGDKDAAGVARALEGVVAEWHLAGLRDAGPRGLDVDAFAARLAGTSAAAGAHHATVRDALAAALAGAAPGDRVLAFGSFHTAAAAIQALAV